MMNVVANLILMSLLSSAMIASPTKHADTDTLSGDKFAGLDSIVSDKELGCILGTKSTTFRLFAPRATGVRLVIFSKYDDAMGQEYTMERDSNGVWEYTSPSVLIGKFYGYRVSGPTGNQEMFNPKVLIGDPYSKAVVTKNNYHHPAKTLIVDSKYDWGDDTFVVPKDHTRMVIYEGHVRDLTAHLSSGVIAKGTYKGLTEPDRPGGLSYLKDLGINALELQPIQEFGNIELPFGDKSVVNDGGEYNTWNPYERNHWGYMTSYFFAPESYYATDGTMERERYDGTDGRAVRELKDLVKTLHREKIAVILDVVYNHVSQYDYNPFKYIDKFYYFNCDTSGNFTKLSGCGNDFRTTRPMARRLIVESVTYWMKEYHIDGFRFDLATMIDWETCKEIAAEAKKINPNVILIAEAWGGGKYDPPGFSKIGWASWNDQIRNGVKGQNPHDGLGFIFGKFQGNNSKKSLMSYVTGTLREDGGMYLKPEHSINYLESHDDNTFGDFIRLGTGDVGDTTRITDTYENAKLNPHELALNKLGALFLLTSQGPVMIGEGQEFARSKVIAKTSAPDPNVGRLDHNSYEKDNETNYLNYNCKTLNAELFSYYKGLIQLRKTHPAFGGAPKKAISFLPTNDDFLIAYTLDEGLVKGTPNPKKFLVILNGNQEVTQRLLLPKGTWSMLVNGSAVSLKKPLRSVTRTISIPPVSGMILMQ
ncbi:MAG TPA: alpha-amylase family glycosyl hydrolase [Bacteroidota bacterium]|nr:alpha-amylase family glycosyl hydrolase [Bacteroidota bacterium]